MTAIPDLNLFMVCEVLNQDALARLPDAYRIRALRRDELDLWKAFPFDTPEQASEYRAYMTDYFQHHYAPKGDLFFETCLVVVDVDDVPIATCFAWKHYDRYTTIHWLKVLPEHEGRGIGRGLMSHIMASLGEDDYPVYLHTQTPSVRAVGLYSDLGFALIDLPLIDGRPVDMDAALPILRAHMTPRTYAGLRIVTWDAATETFVPSPRTLW